MSSLQCTSFLKEKVGGEKLIDIKLGESGQTNLFIYEKIDTGYRSGSSDSEEEFLLPIYIGDKLIELFNWYHRDIFEVWQS